MEYGHPVRGWKTQNVYPEISFRPVSTTCYPVVQMGRNEISGYTFCLGYNRAKPPFHRAASCDNRKVRFLKNSHSTLQRHPTALFEQLAFFA
jgi:hypothetical protein